MQKMLADDKDDKDDRKAHKDDTRFAPFFWKALSNRPDGIFKPAKDDRKTRKDAWPKCAIAFHSM